MNRLVRSVLTMLAVLLAVGMASPTLRAAAEDVNVEDLSANPTDPAYSPMEWAKEWSPSKVDYDELQQDDPADYLKDTGLVREGSQRDALTAADLSGIKKQWKQGLLKKIWDLAAESVSGNHAGSLKEGTWVAPEWTVKNSNQIAMFLGADSYATLTPALKSLVERSAVIITGDNKPPMPDDEWSTWMSAEEKAAYTASPAQRYNWEVTLVIPGKTAEVKQQCNDEYGPALLTFCETVKGGLDAAEATVDAAAAVVSFADDPIGWINERLAAGASAVFEWVATTANEATMPDLTLTSWISTYQKGFAAGIIVLFLVLMYQFVRLSRGKISSAEMLESIVARTPAYFAGVIFGPPLAQFLIVGSGHLTDDIITGMTGGTGEATEAIKAAVESAATGGILGGPIVALIVLFVLIVACFFIFITLCIQTITIYMSSVVFGIAFAWIADARRTNGSMKIPYIFLALVFSRPLLFFLLSFGMGFIRDAFSGSADSTAKVLGTLIMACVLLAMLALSPVALLHFAPVMPTGSDPTGGAGGSSRSLSGPAPQSGGGSGGGSSVQNIARTSSASAAAPAAAGGSPPGGSSGGGGGSGQQGSSPAAGAAQKSGVSASGSKSGASADSPSSRVLGRTRRHGGGTPSPAAAAMLAGSKGSAGSSKSSSGGGLKSGAGRARRGAQKAARPVAEAARNVGGSQPWE